VLARPGFVRAAYHPLRRHPDQAALSFTALLRQGQRRRSLTSTQINSASRRTQRRSKIDPLALGRHGVSIHAATTRNTPRPRTHPRCCFLPRDHSSAIAASLAEQPASRIVICRLWRGATDALLRPATCPPRLHEPPITREHKPRVVIPRVGVRPYPEAVQPTGHSCGLPPGPPSGLALSLGSSQDLCSPLNSRTAPPLPFLLTARQCALMPQSAIRVKRSRNESVTDVEPACAATGVHLWLS